MTKIPTFSQTKASKITPKGDAGYDNARENIDPHVKTQAVSSQEIRSKKIVAPDTNGIRFYANDGVTLIAILDNDGNFIIKGRNLSF